MKVCALTNLSTAGGLALVLAFVGCGSSGPEPAAPTEPAAAPTATEAAAAEPPPDVEDEATADDDDGTGSDQANTGGHKAASGKDTTCPLDGSSGDDAPQVAGVKGEPRDVNTMGKIVIAYRGCVRRCYEKAREKLPNLKGDMTIKMVVTPKGKVKEAAVDMDRSDIFAPMVVDCAIDVLKQLNYGEHPEGMETTLNYPFNFKP